MLGLVNKYLAINTLRVIEIELKDEIEGALVRSIVVSKNENEFKASHEKEWNSLSEALNEIDKDHPILISLIGNGIISKQTDRPIDDLDKVLTFLIGGGNLDDFYVDSQRADETTHSSIIRMETIQEILGLFGDHFLIDISVGPGNLSILPDKILNDNYVNAYNFSIKDNQIVALSKEKKELCTYVISDFNLENKYLLSLSSGLQYLFFINDELKTSLPLFSESQKEFRFKKMFSVAAKILSISLLAILMANYVYLQKMEKNYLELSSIYELNKSQIKRSKQLEKEFLLRKELIQKSGWKNSSRTSIIADRLASTVPSKVVLNSIQINPIEKKNGKNKMLEFKNNFINVKGFSPSNIDLNNWINDIENYESVEKVVLKHFDISNSKNKKEFELEITLNNGI